MLSQFYRLPFAPVADTDNRDLLMAEEEIQHSEVQKSFLLILCLLNLLSNPSPGEVLWNMALHTRQEDNVLLFAE